MGGLQVEGYPQPARTLTPGRGHPSRPVSCSYFVGGLNLVLSISVQEPSALFWAEAHFQLEIVTAVTHKWNVITLF